MGIGTEGQQKMREELEGENEGIAIPAQVLWLLITQTLRESRRNREFAASSLFFVVKGNKVGQHVIKKGFK